MTEVKEKAEELEKFLKDRLSEADYETFGRLLKDVMSLSLNPIKDAIEDLINE